MLGNVSWSSEFISYLVSNLYTDYIHHDIVFPGEWTTADSGQVLEAHFAKAFGTQCSRKSQLFK